MKEAFILVIDGKPERRKLLTDILRQINEEEMVLPALKICQTPAEAVAFAASHDCPIIFTGVELPGMDGFALIRTIREQNSRTNFILLAEHQEYVMQALRMKLRLSGVILEKLDLQTVGDLLCNLWYPLDSAIYG